MHQPSVTSTHRVVKSELKNYHLKTNQALILTADKQTQGRGTHHREWLSPKGGLYLSLALPVLKAKKSYESLYLSTACMAQAIKDMTGLNVSLKWPNDFLYKNRKVGGCVAETVHLDRTSYLLVGIGLNLNMSREKLSRVPPRFFEPDSLSAILAQNIDSDKLVIKFLDVFFAAYPLYLKRGFPYVVSLWEKHLPQNKRVRYQASGKSTVEEGVMLGLSDEGALILAHKDGTRSRLYSGEIQCFLS